MDSDTAVSDLIATVALIAVFVTGAAIVGVALLSHPPGDAAPAMIARNVTDGGKLYIYHEGGDPLEREYFEILVDGARQTGNITLINASGYESKDWATWKTGEALNLSDVTRDLPENTRIQIVGEGVGRIGSDWLLHEIRGSSAVIPTTIPTTEPTQVPLVAGFTANPTFGSAPLTVQFTDTSAGGATLWSWDFGDGGTSTAQNPTHTYANEGNYTVKLTVKNTKDSNTVTKMDYIIVTEDHVSRLEVNTRAIILFGWAIPVNDISITYSRDSETGSGKTPFVLSKIAPGDSSFSATLTAPDKIPHWIPLVSRKFDGWQVDDAPRYGKDIRTITVQVADGESRTATAYYKLF